MFLKRNMTGHTNVMSYGIIAAKIPFGYTLAMEATEMSTRLELCPFMRMKRDNISITKNLKRGVVRGASPQKCSGIEVEMRRVRTTSRM